MVGEDMCAMEVDVQCVGKCVRNRNTYWNILRRNMRGLKGKEEGKEEVVLKGCPEQI